ncbi:hypothetical protein PHMEG_00033267 [Phytophthora megakarya]|uniref:Uncharacterized protein n=1 Tax=Phytophthora megakarya TaxID=4795 RepID=A0A225UTM9_9STRA|nr:hypothetical protein PHMEG_00033267 [Phytophthora megakarya]
MAAMSALALRDAGDMDVKGEQKLLLNHARHQASGSQSPEVSHVKANYLAQDPLESCFAEYQDRAETHMEAQRRQHLDEMTAFEKEFQTLRLERDQEHETNKNLQSFLVGRLKKQGECQGMCDKGLKPVPEMTAQLSVKSSARRRLQLRNTFQRKSEIPREFYYRLNKIAGKADIDIKSTDIARDRRLKVFIKKLKNTQLRSTLQGQRVRSLEDLEHIFKQHEEIWRSDDREAHPMTGHDSTFGNRQRQKINNRAYNVNEDEVFENDDEQQCCSSSSKVSFGGSVPDRDVDGLAGDIPDGNMMLRRQAVTSEVYRVLENSGWRPPNSEYRLPPKTDFGKLQPTRHCDNCGEGSHSTKFCWVDIECNRCHKKGHPAKY